MGPTLNSTGFVKFKNESVPFYFTKPDLTLTDRKIRGFLRRGVFDKAVEQFLEENNKGTKFSVTSYNSFINKTLHMKEYKTAYFFFEYMLTNGVAPRVSTYQIILNAALNMRNFIGIDSFYNNMKENGCPIDLSIIHTVMTSRIKNQDLDGALEAFYDLNKFKIEPNTLVFNTLLDGFIHFNRVKEGITFYKIHIRYTYTWNYKENNLYRKIDVHNLSHGAALIKILSFISEKEAFPSFILTVSNKETPPPDYLESMPFDIQSLLKYRSDLEISPIAGEEGSFWISWNPSFF